MIPLTRSRLNRYNAGVIDLSTSSHEAGRPNQPPAVAKAMPPNFQNNKRQDKTHIQSQSQSNQDKTASRSPGMSPSRKRKISMESAEEEQEKKRPIKKQAVSVPELSASVLSKSVTDLRMKEAASAPTSISTRGLIHVSAPHVTRNYPLTSQPALGRNSISNLSQVLVQTSSSTQQPESTHTSGSASTPALPSIQMTFAAQIESGNSFKFSDTNEEEDVKDKGGEELQNARPPGHKTVGTAKDVLTAATAKECRKYRAHWKEWCERKRYDGDSVTHKKLLLYAKEIMALGAYEDKEHPHLSIRPIYKKNMRDRVHPTALKRRLASLYILHREQRHHSGQMSNLGQELKTEVHAMIEEYTKLFFPKGDRDHGSIDGSSELESNCLGKTPYVTESTLRIQGSVLSSTAPADCTNSPASASNSTSSSYSISESILASSDSTLVTSTSFTTSSSASSVFLEPASATLTPFPTKTSESISTSTLIARKPFTDSISTTEGFSAIQPTSATVQSFPAFIMALVSTSSSKSTSDPTVSQSTRALPASASDPAPSPGSSTTSQIQGGPSINTSNQGNIASEKLEGCSEGCSEGIQHSSTKLQPVEDPDPEIFSMFRRHRARQAHWNEWCIRKRYEDGNFVTPEKFIKYTAELTSQESFEDKGNPHLSVRPIYRLDRQGSEPIRVSKSTMAQYISSVRALHKEQCLKSGASVSKDIAGGNQIPTLLHHYGVFVGSLPPTTKHTLVKKKKGRADDEGKEYSDSLGSDLGEATNYSESQETGQSNHDDDQGEDGEDSGIGEGSERDEVNGRDERTGLDLQEVMVVQDDQVVQDGQEDEDDSRHKLNCRITPIVSPESSMRILRTSSSNNPSLYAWNNMCQRRFRSAVDYFAKSGHDLSMTFPSHLHLVHVWSENDESLFTTGIAMTKVSKEAQADNEQYSIFLREKDVNICPISALAFYLLALFSNPAPSPHTDNWIVDERGNDISLGLETDSTSGEAVSTSYNCSSLYKLTPGLLPTAQRLGSYILTATLSNNSPFQLPRSKVLPSAELQKQLFPFIENYFADDADWQTWVDSITMDRPLDTSPSGKHRPYYKAGDFPTIRFMSVLACLREVILQDYAIMMTCEGEDGQRLLRDEYACVYNNPVFSTPEFLVFAAQLHKAIGDADILPPSTSPKSSSVNGVVSDLQVQESVPIFVTLEQTLDAVQDSPENETTDQGQHNIHEILFTGLPSSASMKEIQETVGQDNSGMNPQVEGLGAVVTVVKKAPSVELSKVRRGPRGTFVKYSGATASSLTAVSVLDINRNDSYSDVSPPDPQAQNTNSDSNRPDTSPQESQARDINNDGNTIDKFSQEPQVDQKEDSLMDYEATELLDDNQELPYQHQSGDLPSTNATPEPARVTAPRCSIRPRLSSTAITQPLISTESQDSTSQSEGISSLSSFTIGLARVSTGTKGQDQHKDSNNNDVRQHRQLIQTLSERVAFLEKKKQNRQATAERSHSQYGLPTPKSPSATSSQCSIDVAFQDRNHHSGGNLDRNRLKNQTLCDRLAVLEQENKALEQRDRGLAEPSHQLQPNDQLLRNASPTITAATSTSASPSRPVHLAFHSDSTVYVRNDYDCDIGQEVNNALEQEVRSLRVHLAAKNQEKSARLDYTLTSIELTELLDSKMVQMEQSIHGLWAMMACNEASRFSTGSSSITVEPQQQQMNPHHQQPQQREQQEQDRHHMLRLRVDAMRRRIGSHGHIRS
ncbi:hypothetical protein EC991_006644 [Linnemannia zychae]|nr:hypothetical protein EC991_006644 [Linnemannia zychae]